MWRISLCLEEGESGVSKQPSRYPGCRVGGLLDGWDEPRSRRACGQEWGCTSLHSTFLPTWESVQRSLLGPLFEDFLAVG